MWFKTILADPPWPEYGGGKICRGANKHYPLMSIKEILALSDFVKTQTDPAGCHLYLWVTNNQLPNGLKVMEAWGFEYKTIITWLKDRMGLGQYFRGITEHCLFGTSGFLDYRIRDDGKRAQGITGFTAPRKEHSRKPVKIYEMIKIVSYPPYLEMFARPPHPFGWAVWGNEVNQNDFQKSLELID